MQHVTRRHKCRRRPRPPHATATARGNIVTRALQAINGNAMSAAERTRRMRLGHLAPPELRSVLESARQIQTRHRETFYKCIASELIDISEPGAGDVNKAIRKALEDLHLQWSIQI